MSPLPARLLILLLLALPCSVEARTVVVDTTADDPALTACDDAVSNDCSLRGALAAANTAAEHYDIQLPSGTYATSVVSLCPFVSAFGDIESISATTLCINRDVAIIGSGSDTTIIDGLQSDRVIALDKMATAAISGVTITRGVVPNVGTFIGGGGGILNHGTLTLADVVITRNTGGPGGGGGIFNAGTLTVFHSTIADNDSVHEGGGISNLHIASMGRVSTGTLTVIDSTIAQNSASSGGGIINGNSIVTITGSTLSGNTVSGGGGGIFNFAAGTVHLVNSTLTGNDAFNGGAINNGSSCVAFSCLVTLNNVTIAGNSAEVAGGGITNQGDQPVPIANTILAGNTVRSGSGPDCLNGSAASALVSGGYNIIGNPEFCVVLGDTTGNQVGVDPQLGVLAPNGGPTATRGLLEGSPALEHGSPATPGSGGNACATADQRRALRPIGGRCDAGAFERSGALALTAATPRRGGNNGSVIVHLSGGGFAPQATGALLRRAGHADIAGSPVATESAGAALTTTFDLTGAAPGSWDVVVTNPDLASAILPGGFTVETPRAADLFAVIVARSSARPGLPARFAVLYGNRGNTDAIGVPLTLGLPASFARHFSVEVAPPALAAGTALQ